MSRKRRAGTAARTPALSPFPAPPAGPAFAVAGPAHDGPTRCGLP